MRLDYVPIYIQINVRKKLLVCCFFAEQARQCDGFSTVYIQRGLNSKISPSCLPTYPFQLQDKNLHGLKGTQE